MKGMRDMHFTLANWTRNNAQLQKTHIRAIAEQPWAPWLVAASGPVGLLELFQQKPG